ncbi:beta-propeller fold lactonase family protein [Rudaea sp.]|uniref:beta-propeller fold lactonase family protein n=1 Tax=Rudaea sp. TaxID=2136325 RepID=UPI002ED5D8C0
MRAFSASVLSAAVSLAVVFSAQAAAPATNAAYAVVKQYDIGGPGGWDYLLADPQSGHLFVSRFDRSLVVNLADGTVAATIPGTEGVHGFAIVHELGRGYTSNGRADNLTVFDLTTLKPIGTIPAGGHNPDAILYDKASAHLFAFNGRSKDVTVIDPKTGKLVATIPVGGKPEFAATDDKGHVFFNIEDTSELAQIDSRNAKLVARWKLAECEDPSGLAFDEAHHRLFSVCQNERMVVTDSTNGKRVAEVKIGKGPDAAAYDAQRGLVFSSNGEDGTLTIVKQDDADHYRVAANVPTEASARTLALDPQSHNVYLVAAKFGPKPEPTKEQPHPRAPVLDGSFKVLVVADQP